MDKKQIPTVSSTYWWTGQDKEIISPPLDYSFMKAVSFDGMSLNFVFKEILVF